MKQPQVFGTTTLDEIFDLTIIVDTGEIHKRFPVTKAHLRLQSNYFNTLINHGRPLENGTTEIDVPEDDPQVFAMLMQAICNDAWRQHQNHDSGLL